MRLLIILLLLASCGNPQNLTKQELAYNSGVLEDAADTMYDTKVKDGLIVASIRYDQAYDELEKYEYYNIEEE